MISGFAEIATLGDKRTWETIGHFSDEFVNREKDHVKGDTNITIHHFSLNRGAADVSLGC